MTYASEKLYNDVIKRMLSRLATIVKVREIVPHLHCLTQIDREEIEAKREVSGNFNAMQLLVDCLRRRENWPEEFISALQACEQWTLASEISDAYDRIRGIKPQKPASTAASGPAPASAAVSTSAPVTAHVTAPAAITPPTAPPPVPASVTTVTTATIHNAPRTTLPLLTPSSEEPPAAAAVSAPAQSPPESLPKIDSPCPAEAPVSVSVPEAPAPKPSQSVKSSPPVSANPAMPPFPLSSPKVTPPLQQNEVPIIPCVTPSLDSTSDLTLIAISEPSSAAATSLPTSITTISPFQNDTPETFRPNSVLEDSKTPLGVPESSTSARHPIQDTSPPEKVAVLTQDISSTASQRMETTHSMVPSNSQAQATSPGQAQVSPLPSHAAVESREYFSKPGILMGGEPSFASFEDLQISRHPAETAGSSPVQPPRPAPVSGNLQPRVQTQEPCSVTSDQLLISDATASTNGSLLTQSLTVPPGNLAEENSFSEGDVSVSDNQPVEDHYDSFSQREPGTMVNVVQFSEEPSVLNGQPPSMMGNAVHANESLNHNRPNDSPSQSVVSENQHSLKNQSITQRNVHADVHAGEHAGACPKSTTPACEVSGINASGQPEQNEETQRGLLQLQSDPRYIAAATAVVGVAAVFMAWKLRH